MLKFDPKASTEALTDTHIKDVVSHTLGIGLKAGNIGVAGKRGGRQGEENQQRSGSNDGTGEG